MRTAWRTPRFAGKPKKPTGIWLFHIGAIKSSRTWASSRGINGRWECKNVRTEGGRVEGEVGNPGSIRCHKSRIMKRFWLNPDYKQSVERWRVDSCEKRIGNVEIISVWFAPNSNELWCRVESANCFHGEPSKEVVFCCYIALNSNEGFGFVRGVWKGSGARCGRHMFVMCFRTHNRTGAQLMRIR
jgi:hypothetical protein